jgi:hypothetical protein
VAIASPMKTKDLSKEPPSSPRERVRDYVILRRTMDKCRATLAGTAGDYHYDCPLDNVLFSFKGITGDDFKNAVKRGLTEEQLALWVDEQGVPKTPEEIQAWSDNVEAYSMLEDPEKRDFFIAECEKLGLDPNKTTLFDWLEADDRASFKKP